MTHLHNDHASGAVQFPRATFVVTSAEWDAACAGGFPEGYRHAHYDHPFDWRTVDYDAPGALPHAGFERSLDLFGDGSVRARQHARAHARPPVDRARAAGGEMLLTADAAYTRRTIDEQLVPIFFADVPRTSTRSRRSATTSSSGPMPVVIAGHDASRWPQLQPVYA